MAFGFLRRRGEDDVYLAYMVQTLPQTSSKISSVGWFGIWYIFMFSWWILLNSVFIADTTQKYFFGFVFGCIPLIGGLLGLRNSLKWGGAASVMGRATGLLSLGLISWALGGLIWAYYNFFGGVDIPYPSWADVAYVVSWPLWTLGAIQLSRATGAQFSLRKVKGRLVLYTVPLLVIALSYYLLVVIARGGEVTTGESLLKTFFDLAYPIGDVVVLSFSLVIYGLSFKYLGGKYQKSILILLAGFIVNYIADFAFSWTTTMEIFAVGGWVDLLFMTAVTLLSVGVLGLNPLASRE